jgi:uncharacterized protein YndB with AHSA1/START domain
VDVRSDRRFEFAHDAPTVWAAIARVDQYPVWWPWLRCDGRTLAAGERWRCTVRPPLLYSVEFVLEIVEVECERLIRAELVGDLVGWARLTLDERDDGATCTVRLESSLEARRGPARLVGLVVRPLATFGHDWVLDAGVRRFRSEALEGRPE